MSTYMYRTFSRLDMQTWPAPPDEIEPLRSVDALGWPRSIEHVQHAGHARAARASV